MIKAHLIIAGLLAVFLTFNEARADSIMDALKNIGEEANMANESFLNTVDPNNPEQQMQAYRRLERERIAEISQVAGVDPEVIRQLRQNGETWEEIAAKYKVDLGALPSPQSLYGPAQ